MIAAKQANTKNDFADKGPHLEPMLLTSRQAAALLQFGERTCGD
jgi:hypothetical protein